LLKLDLYTLKRISTLHVHNVWQKSHKANINYNFAHTEASEFDEYIHIYTHLFLTVVKIDMASEFIFKYIDVRNRSRKPRIRP
jgi:hypothetical protein